MSPMSEPGKMFDRRKTRTHPPMGACEIETYVRSFGHYTYYACASCSGPVVWGQAPEMQDWLWRASLKTSIWHNRAKLHPSHHLAWYRVFVFCCKCGYYVSGKAVRLTKECQVRQHNPVPKGRLRRLLQGKAPIKYVKWPRPPQAKYAAAKWLRPSHLQ